MKKKDLKSKMIVKLRNGNFYLVVDDVLVRENGYNLLNQYFENLLCKTDSYYDIVEIFEYVNNYYKFTNGLSTKIIRQVYN